MPAHSASGTSTDTRRQVAYHRDEMEARTTTNRLDAQISRHHTLIGQLVERCGLPLHVLFVEEMAENAHRFRQALNEQYEYATVAFAVKSNPCRGAIRAAKQLGLGADVASEYELQAVLEEQIEPSEIVCNGNAKSANYLDMALHAGALIALDNENEIELLEERARRTTKRGTVLIRFRGMPLSGLTSDDQTTAADWTKFGFHIHDAKHVFARIASSRLLDFRGISAHIGTQIASPVGYELLFEHLFLLADQARQSGQSIDYLDIGGGFPVSFFSRAEWEAFTARLLKRLQSDAAEESVTWNDLPMGYADEQSQPTPRWIGKSYWSAFPASQMLERILDHHLQTGETVRDRLDAIGRPRLVVEPGRSLMASAGITIAEVISLKEVLGHHVVSLDMGINNHGTNLISPDIFPAAVLPGKDGDHPVEAFLAGRLCFSGDMVSKAKVRLNRLPAPGEWCVIFHTGAYSADHFASNSCGFPRPAKAAIRSDGSVEIWRDRETFTDVFGNAADQLTLDVS